MRRDAISDSAYEVTMPSCPARLATGMLLEFADGWLSAKKLIKHFHGAKYDGSTDAIINELGRHSPDQHSGSHVLGFLEKLPILDVLHPIPGDGSSVWQ